MRDSVNPFAIPVDTEIVAGYVDGLYKWSDAGWARFAGHKQVRIAVSAATVGADVYDVESGDLTPGQIPGVLKRERASKRNPTAYCNRSNLPLIREGCIAAGLSEPPYWLSTLDGSQPFIPGIFAIQDKGSNMTGGNYDESVVLDYWPTIDDKAGDPMDVQVIKAVIAVAWKAYFGHYPTPQEQQDFDNVVSWSQADGSKLFDQVQGLANNPKALANVQRI